MLEFTDTVIGKVEVTITQEVTARDIEGIMVGAIEGGINYWGALRRNPADWDEKPKDEPASTWATQLLLEGKEVHFFNVEEPHEEIEPLTLDKLLFGIKLNAKKRFYDSDLDQADAITYDCIIQYALFGELVYG